MFLGVLPMFSIIVFLMAKKFPKWKPHSTRCMYVGKSPAHASTVPLVLNPNTGTITPRFHAVFDDWFQTVPIDVEN